MKPNPTFSHWPHKEMTDKFSLGDFRQTASSYLERLQSAHQGVMRIYEAVRSTNQFIPSDCDLASDSIIRLQESVHQFNQLLDSTEHLPIQVVPTRYPILFSLHSLDDATYDLLNLLRMFRMICLESSQEAQRLHTKIARKFSTVIRTGEEIKPASRTLLG